MRHAAPVNPGLLGPALEAVAEPGGRHLDPRRLIELTGMRVQELAALAGVDRNTIARNPHSPKVQEAVGEVVRLLESATEVAGDLDRALLWYRHQPIEAYRFRTPAELVADGHAEAVMAYLDDLRHGTYA
ncbi:antitoxin Xre/MbcA/ParS toxin-binding domain-containing protein [Azospirillum thermophilum]|nr:antitoxin Xre/MbcA/ParS toxin-binding domain-containing protein [Azospirillum thermophilum]